MSFDDNVTSFLTVTLATCPSPLCLNFNVSLLLITLPSARVISKYSNCVSSHKTLYGSPSGVTPTVVIDDIFSDSVISFPDILATVTVSSSASITPVSVTKSPTRILDVLDNVITLVVALAFVMNFAGSEPALSKSNSTLTTSTGSAMLSWNIYMPGSTTSGVVTSITVPVTLFSTVPCTGTDIFPNFPKPAFTTSLLRTRSALIFFGARLAPANSVPEESLNLTDMLSTKASDISSKLCPIVEILFGTAVIFSVVFANETFALSVITSNAELVPYSLEPTVNVLSVVSLTINTSPALPPILSTSNTISDPILKSCSGEYICTSYSTFVLPALFLPKFIKLTFALGTVLVIPPSTAVLAYNCTSPALFVFATWNTFPFKFEPLLSLNFK